MTRQQIETALDNGLLEVQWGNGKWYKVRRNGATKTWKRDAERFAIPCKTGFRDCFTIAFYSCDVGPSSGLLLDSQYIRVVE